MFCSECVLDVLNGAEAKETDYETNHASRGRDTFQDRRSKMAPRDIGTQIFHPITDNSTFTT